MPTYIDPKFVHVEPCGRFPFAAVIVLKRDRLRLLSGRRAARLSGPYSG
ncbi:MAG TPA: hypothetical protein VME44_25835 [Streptosporangiaceae bacterium]|nr:hypothetical protein [Streptosporangiaceae bacterium]